MIGKNVAATPGPSIEYSLMFGVLALHVDRDKDLGVVLSPGHGRR